MLKINFNAETPDDVISPITVAMALIHNPLFKECDLEEIAKHLLVYTACNQRARSKYEENQNKSQ